MNSLRITLVIPVLDESENVGPLAEECLALLPALPNLKVLFVDDGSRDGTAEALERLQTEDSTDCLQVLRHESCLGQSAALFHGLGKAVAFDSEVFVTMDGDRQNNPADIPGMIDALSEEVDVVCGYRAERKDTWSRRVGSRIGNTVRNWVTRDGLRDTGCSLKVFRAACAADLPPLDGMHRFMGAYFAIHKRRMVEVPVDHRPRVAGQSKYTNLSRLPRTIYDLFGFCWYRRRVIPADLPASQSSR